MGLDIFLFLLGLAIALLTLRDVFETVVVHGGSRALLRVAHRAIIVLLPVCKYARGRQRGLSSTFGPLVLVMSFVIWMGLLTLGFGLMAYAFRDDFEVRLHSFGDALYLVGSALATVGLSASHPHGHARWVILAAGFCGLAVITMAVTYLLEVQNSIDRRDTGIMKLNTSAGDPPSALALLERFAAIRNQREIADVLQEARNWCATVRQSHSAHPSLIYFRTDRTGAGWPAALGALLDLAVIAELILDDEALYGPAILLRDDGLRMAAELAAVVRLKPEPTEASAAELREVAERLRGSGYPLRAAIDFDSIANVRGRSQAAVAAMADHLGLPRAMLIAP